MEQGKKAIGGAFKSGADPRRNVHGRPRKGHAFTDMLRRVGEEPGTMEEVARKVWALAKGGSLPAIAFLADRLDGKAAQMVEVEDKPSALNLEELLEIATKRHGDAAPREAASDVPGAGAGGA